ncbi:MAG TPA: MFS transporter [Epsilonproteobacteria bacterium]|nr:MFS transporter [Campylobacterota bacterium]
MLKQVLPLSFIVALRFFGLFVVLPVISIYALSLPGASGFLAGLVVGGYALTQALFQVPFGVMSDKIGRKITLTLGLIVFAIGSFVCAFSDNIYMLLVGRFLQGAGAIGAVVSATIADFVKEEQRGKAMAIMGATIALSFAAAMIVSPIIGGLWGIDKLFLLTALLALIALAILFLKVPTPPTITHSYEGKKVTMADVFKDKSLVKMYITFLFHSSIMTMAFFIIPLVMTKGVEDGGFGWEKIDLWKVYLPAVIFGILAMGPAVVFGEKKEKGKLVFVVSIALIATGFALMGFGGSVTLFIIGVVLFFMGFNMFEPLLQSFVSKLAKVHQKGAAIGVANTFGYTGIFLGGIAAGLMTQHLSVAHLATFVLALCIGWLAWVASMSNPNARANLYIPLDQISLSQLKSLESHDAIVETYTNQSEQIAVIKYEKGLIDEEEIKALLS